MDNFSYLQKLLVIVPSNQCTNFRDNHITGATSEDRYWSKIVFLEDTNEIYTHGNIYGCENDINSIKAILAGYGDEGRYATVQDEIDEIISALTTSSVIGISYTSENGYVVEDKISLTYTNGILQLGGGTSYGTPLGNQFEIADTGDDISYENGSYIAATPNAIKEYITSKLGEIANAVTLEGNQTKMSVILDKESGVTLEDVGNQYVMSTAYSFIFPKTGENSKQYKLDAGDNVIITNVENGIVTDITVVEHNLDGAVTASAALTTNHIVIGAGNPADQSVMTSAYVIGTDNDIITASSAANTLATEQAVAAAITSNLEALDSSVSYQAAHVVENYVSYSYTQTDGLLTNLSVSIDQATVSYENSEITITGNGFIDNEAASAIVAYITGQIESLDESYTSIDTGDASYITVSYTVTGNDISYIIDTNIVSLRHAIGMSYNSTTGQWEPASPTTVNHGLPDVVDLVNEIVEDERIIATALNSHEARIHEMESTGVGVSVVSGNATALSVQKTQDTFIYTITPQTGDVENNAGTLVTGGQVYSFLDALNPWQEYPEEQEEEQNE